MESQLRVLFVEDSATDAELEERELRRGGLAFTSKRVDTREALTSALDEFKPDLVISDYSLPNMDGLGALKIVRQVSADLPFIFVSGTIGEERAIESLKNGATDYVVKDRLAGLFVRVQRALREAQERTRSKTIEAQLRQAQKMEAIGRLAGGVAHDFNNLMTVVMGYSDLLLIDSRLDTADKTKVEEIGKASRTAASLTQQLLAFSRKQMLQPKVINLNTLARGMQRMLQTLVSDDVVLKMDLSPVLGMVRADPVQVEQVIMNLAVNARDAMAEGGTLVVETINTDLDATYCRQFLDLAPGRYVQISVTDTGCGMNDSVLAKIFEPFFTTKDPGKGTGLGLSIVYGIVKQSGGHVSVYSEVGHGTTFKINFPRVDAMPEESGNTTERIRKGTETILVVEDNDPVRGLVGAVLRSSGYFVHEVRHGADALKFLAAHPEKLHLLVTDVVMPGMSGQDLAQAVLKTHRDLKVLFMSGYSEAAMRAQGVLIPGSGFIGKPFAPDALARKVRSILDTSPTAG